MVEHVQGPATGACSGGGCIGGSSYFFKHIFEFVWFKLNSQKIAGADEGSEDARGFMRGKLGLRKLKGVCVWIVRVAKRGRQELEELYPLFISCHISVFWHKDARFGKPWISEIKRWRYFNYTCPLNSVGVRGNEPLHSWKSTYNFTVIPQHVRFFIQTSPLDHVVL